jgi:hypothetical protein
MPANGRSIAKSHSSPESAAAAPIEQGRATFHLPGDLINELRNAVVALSGPPDRLTMSKLAEEALRRELDRIRATRLGRGRGKRFPQRQGEVTRGRPIG